MGYLTIQCESISFVLLYGLYVYVQLPFDDIEFEPWELGRNNSSTPAEHRPHGTSQNVPQNQTGGPTLEWTRQDSTKTGLPIEKKLKGVLVRTLKDNHPEIYTVVVWAKGYYRSQHLLNEPYPTAEQKLLLAEDSYMLSFANHPISSFPSVLNLNDLLILVSLLLLSSAYLTYPLQVAKEHHVFRSKLIDLASEVIHTEFPLDLEISAVEVVKMLEAVYDQKNSTVDNFFASRKPATSVPNASGSGSHLHSGFEFEMVRTLNLQFSLST
jgi:hypothetical protein